MKQGWKAKKLEDIATLRPNKKEAKSVLQETDEVSFVPMECLLIDSMALAKHESRPLSKVYSGYTYFRDGDVLLAKITPCFENGKLGIASGLTNGIGFGSSEFFVIRPSDEVLAEYLYHFLNREEFRIFAKDRMTGAVGHKRVPKELLSEMLVPLPSLDEQHRIVEKLSKLHASVDAAMTHYRAQMSNLEDLQQSLLQKAYAGELT